MIFPMHFPPQKTTIHANGESVTVMYVAMTPERVRELTYILEKCDIPYTHAESVLEDLLEEAKT